jgi:hypothetical protein
LLRLQPRNALRPIARLRALTRRITRGEYVGVDAAARGLRLYLADHHRFLIRLALSDPVVGTIVAHRELAGTWRRTGDGLELQAPERTLEYRWSRDRADMLVWHSSNLPTFADGLTLVRAAGSNTTPLNVGRRE